MPNGKSNNFQWTKSFIDLWNPKAPFVWYIIELLDTLNIYLNFIMIDGIIIEFTGIVKALESK